MNAKTGDNLDDLQYYLQKHSRKLPEYGMDMPCSWLSVRSFFVDNLATQDNRKLITTAEFEALCDKHGVNKIGRPLLLDYLHHHGYLYRHKNLGDRLIADQRWALEAIYKPLERGARHYEDFKQQRKGRIPVWQLFEAFGGGYTEDEKWLFLEFMRSCGLCFQLNTHPWREGRDENDVYVFPQFLPEGKPKRVERFWQRTEKVRYMKYTLRWLNDELIQAFIVELGRKTEPEDFWRHGIHVDTDEGSFMAELDHEQEALLVSIEEPALEKWAGPIMEALSPGRDREGWLFSVDGERFESVDGDAFRGIPAGGGKGHSEPDGGKKPLENLDDKHQRLDEVAVLVVAANPTAEKVSLRSEHSKINEAFDGNEEAKRRYPVFLSTGVTREKLIDEIYDKGASRKGVIVHFVGHGRESRRSNGADGGIVLHGDGVQQEQTLSGRELRNILDDLSCQSVDFRMVFLNACHTASLAETIGEMGVPAVGIDDWQSDDGAPPFAAGFYRHFARTGDIRQSLRTAVTYGIAEDSKLRRKVHLYIDGERCPL
ncbi:MAG TPA: CHAT domain-containing protein [Gammaproteobacteria bacterium]|nr:CHAT domain-containing protein [Gammaproteobacteria bacterium]